MLDEKILNVLRTHRDSYIPGEELCKSADISRSAIWKRIESLRQEGYEIEALPHLGYRLTGIPDSLLPMEIKWKLHTKVLGREIISYKQLDSTNDSAYELAEKGMREGTVIIAEEQAKGKGRHGRAWASPAKGGIYMSCILRPGMPPNEIPRITLIAAVSVAKAVRDVTGLPATIKWPNDILVHGKKVCGILTEMKAEQDMVDFIILGMGINVNTSLRHLPKGGSSLREELRNEGSDPHISRIELVKRVLEELERDYFLLQSAGSRPIIEEWKHLSDMLGGRVRVSLQSRSFEGLAHDIDPDGALVIRLDSGILQKVSSGDVIMLR